MLSPKGVIAYPHHNLDENNNSWKTNGLINYGPDNCEWNVKAPDGYLINITIIHFDTSPQDKLKVNIHYFTECWKWNKITLLFILKILYYCNFALS